MAIRYSNSAPTAGKYENTAITAIKYRSGTYRFLDTIKITFVEGGVSTTVDYAIGATVNRATAPSGATFVGWSTSASGANPVKTFTATQNATYYRVISAPYPETGNTWVVGNTLSYSKFVNWGPLSINSTIYQQVKIMPYSGATSYDRVLNINGQQCYYSWPCYFSIKGVSSISGNADGYFRITEISPSGSKIYVG